MVDEPVAHPERGPQDGVPLVNPLQLILQTEKHVWSLDESCSDSQNMDFTLPKLISTAI